jgi:hypothetical protein
MILEIQTGRLISDLKFSNLLKVAKNSFTILLQDYFGGIYGKRVFA